MTRAAISRRAFERAFAAKFDVYLYQAHKARMRFEERTGEHASRAALAKHPRIAAGLALYASTIPSPAPRHAGGMGGGELGLIPMEFLDEELYNWEEIKGDEEAEY